MPEAWIRLACPSCDERWEDNPADLPPPGERFTCRHCGTTRPTSEFMATERSLDVLESFHA